MKKLNINLTIASMLIVMCTFSLAGCNNVENKTVSQNETKTEQLSTKVEPKATKAEKKEYVDGAEEICLSEGGTYELFYSEEAGNYSVCTYENGATVTDYKDFGDFFENR